MKIIILAGGIGTRFWPVSRRACPKQFYAIIDQRTMIEHTFDRFVGSFSIEDIFFSTTFEFKDIIKKIFPKTSRENIIVEPEKRDTGPAMGYVVSFLFLKFPDEPIVFVPSDHYIANVETFIKTLKIAEKLIKKTGKLIDIGIVPNFPSTVLGYTHIGKKYQEIDGIQVFWFREHKEKPNYESAKKYVEAGDYFWHANFYTWTPRAFLEAYKKYAPYLHRHLEKIQSALKKRDVESVKKEYSKMKKISFDYAITEKMDPQEVLIIRGDFGWSDVGAWDVLYDRLSKKVDRYGNISRGLWCGIDTSGSLIYGEKDKLIATIGIDDLIIVDTKDALLICPKGRAQDVKKLVEKLEKEKKDRYL